MLATKDNITGTMDAADKTKGRTPEVSAMARAIAKEPEKSTAGGVVEAVQEKVQDVAGGASELFIQGKETAQEWAAAAVDATRQAKDKAVELASTAADRVGDFGQDVTRLVRRHPLEALLIGFGVGCGVGFLLARVTRHS